MKMHDTLSVLSVQATTVADESIPPLSNTTVGISSVRLLVCSGDTGTPAYVGLLLENISPIVSIDFDE